MRYQVLFCGENVWQLNGQTHYFDSFEDAAKELKEHFTDMEDASMDYEAADYRIVEVN